MGKALFFGSIGVLCETSELQRRAFNAAFEDAGLDWSWDPETYKRLLETPGGVARIEQFAARQGDKVDAQAMHEAKVQFFQQMVLPGSLRPRPGVKEMIAYARVRNIRLGFVTTTGRAQLDLIFSGLGENIPKQYFDYIGHRGRVERGKPAPDIYNDALWALDIHPGDATAVEDTPESAEAALAAGLQVFGYPGATYNERGFPRGVAVLEKLEPCILELELH